MTRLRRPAADPARLCTVTAVLAALAWCLAARPCPALSPPQSPERVQRLLTLLSAVGEEYREGVQEGNVVRPVEFEEAVTFLDDARRLAATLLATPGEVDGLFADLGTAMDGKASVADVAAKLTALRQRIAQTSGVSEQIYPPAPPSAARGRALFQENCATCHGARGDGKGPSAAGLDPPPANFTERRFIHGETPYDFFYVISLGKSRSAMPAWDGVLSVQDRWDLISHLWTLAAGEGGLAEGQGTYLSNCASCHGAAGDGKGAFSAVLMHAAPDLSQPQALARQTDEQLFAAASDGVSGTPMPGFERLLSDEERWKAVAFMRVLSLGGPQVASLVAGGDGAGQRYAGLLRLLSRTYRETRSGPRDSGDTRGQAVEGLAAQVSAAGESLAQRLEAGAPDVATSIRAGSASLVSQVRAHGSPDDVAASVEALANLVETQLGRAEPSSVPAARPAAQANETDTALSETGTLLDSAVRAYTEGDPQAAAKAGDAYLQFEPLEPRLGATDAALKARIEEQFLHLRQALRATGKGEEVTTLATAIHADLEAARIALQPQTSPYALFIESATIILREGFEIVLVIGALLAYVVKTGRLEMRRPIYAGTVLGVAASLVTAVVMDEVLRSHPASSDLLEGVTMLLAAVVLFWVSYWLVSKAEADRWQRYIRGKVQTALSGGRGAALAGAAFLAVYREGFETVLFYQALYASAPAASLTVTAGLAVGGVVLAAVYLVFRRFEVQIPIRQFFFVTGLLLYALAVVFAGQGVHELQEAGLIATTPVAGVPALPLLGLYPSLQSLVAQAIFIVLLAYATVISWRRARRAAVAERNAGIARELHALHTAAVTLRGELQALRSGQPIGAVAALGDRVEGLLVRIDELAGTVRLKTHGGRR